MPADQPSCVIEQRACAFSDRVVRISGHYGLAVKPSTEAVSLYRLDGLKESENGCALGQRPFVIRLDLITESQAFNQRSPLPKNIFVAGAPGQRPHL